MSVIPVTTSLLLDTTNKLPTQLQGHIPTVFEYRGNMMAVWGLKNPGQVIIGIYFLIVKPTGEYCAYSNMTNFVGATAFSFSFCYTRQDLIFFLDLRFGTCPIPTVFENGKLFLISMSFNVPYGTCPTYTVNPNLQQGPMLLGNVDNPLIGFTGELHSGLLYNVKNGVLISEQNVANVNDLNDATNATTAANIYLLDGSIIQLNVDGLGNLNIVSNGVISANYSAGTVCNPTAGIFQYHLDNSIILKIPDENNYVHGASDNSYFVIFSSSNGFYIVSKALGYSQLFSVTSGFGYSCFVNNRVMFYRALNPAMIYITTDLSTHFNNFPSASSSSSSSNTSKISLAYGGLYPVSQGNVLSKYLINFNRPISAIGAYKT
ncbi:MAG TPA: hypothetical protein VMW50_14610 [Dehalococcoidia bacterium]|nr:hypothetical protein [Dehalococcoidia bacterium]